MANKWIFFIVLAICAVGSLGDELAYKIALKNATWTKCQKQQNVPQADMDELYHSRGIEVVKDNKCVIKCILEEYNLYKDGKIITENIPKALQGHWSDPQKTERIIGSSVNCVEAVINKYQGQPDADQCVIPYETFACFFTVMEKEKTEYQ